MNGSIICISHHPLIRSASIKYHAGGHTLRPRTRTHIQSIQRFLSVFERVNEQVPFAGLRWFFDHAETVSEQSLERVAALGGGVAIQHRMAFQGEYFLARYGPEAARAPVNAASSAPTSCPSTS